MREYAKVGPKMWHGQTFKALRKRGTEGVVVGLYLMTSPSSNMLGLFTQPILYMAHETGLGEEGARKGLQSCIEAGFCAYDEDSEVVWVREMAKYQVAEQLEAKDNRCKGIQKDYDALPENPFLGEFFDTYQAAFHLTKRRGKPVESEAPAKPLTKLLRSQEKEQEQEQEKEQAFLPLTGESSRDREPGIDLQGHKLNGHAPKTVPDCPHVELLALWAEVMPDLPQHDPQLWPESTRADHLRARWRSTAALKGWATKDEGLAYFRKLFGWCRNSKFLMGETQTRDRRPFEFELAWLVNATNWTKVHEGKFHG